MLLKKSTLITLTVFILLSSTVSLLLGCSKYPGDKPETENNSDDIQSYYSLGISAFNEGDYENAYYNLKKCEGYENADDLLKHIYISYKETVYTYYDENGNVTSTIEYLRDENGNTYDYIKNEVSLYSFKYDYMFDDNGNIILEKGYDKNGDCAGKVEYEYYENNLLKAYIIYNENEEVTSKYEYSYDENFNITSEALFDGEDVLVQKEEYEYDESGNVTHKYNYFQYGESIYEDTYKYNEDNALVLRITYDGNSDIKYYREYERTYDNNGRMLTELAYNEEGLLYDEFRFEYDEKENLTLRQRYMGGEPDEKTETEYDDMGNPISISYYDYNGDLMQQLKIDRDKNGMESHTAHYDKNGNLYYEESCNEPIFVYSRHPDDLYQNYARTYIEQ